MNQEEKIIGIEIAVKLKSSLNKGEGKTFLKILKKNKQSVIAWIKEENMFQKVISKFDEDTAISILDVVKDQDKMNKTDYRKEFLSEEDFIAFRKSSDDKNKQKLAIYILSLFHDRNTELIQKNDQKVFHDAVRNMSYILAAEMIIILWQTQEIADQNTKNDLDNLLKRMLDKFFDDLNFRNNIVRIDNY